MTERSELAHGPIVTVEVSFDRYLPSLNVYIGKHRHAYNTAKKYWSAVLKTALYGPVGDVEFLKPGTKTVMQKLYVERRGRLEGVFERIEVRGHVIYPGRNVGCYDQGNARAMIEKVLGDVLEEQGHFKRDDNWESFSFGELERSFERGVSMTRLFITGRRPLISEPAITVETPALTGIVLVG